MRRKLLSVCVINFRISPKMLEWGKKVLHSVLQEVTLKVVQREVGSCRWLVSCVYSEDTLF